MWHHSCQVLLAGLVVNRLLYFWREDNFWSGINARVLLNSRYYQVTTWNLVNSWYSSALLLPCDWVLLNSWHRSQAQQRVYKCSAAARLCWDSKLPGWEWRRYAPAISIGAPCTSGYVTQAMRCWLGKSSFAEQGKRLCLIGDAVIHQLS